MSIVESAIQLAAWAPVFPCRPDKRPACIHGFHDATSDPIEIRRLFNGSGALIGVPTGEASGFDVLDVDPRHGGDEWEKANQHRLPETRIHQTMGGGRHWLFRHVEGVHNSASAIAPGIDVRGSGGYVVVPPSPSYSVVSDAEIAHWPDWLLAEILPKTRAADPKPAPSSYDPIPSARLEGFVRAVLSRVSSAPEGQKHFILRNQAMILGGVAHLGPLSKPDLVRRLMDALPATALDRKGAEKTAEWGVEMGMQNPLDLPDRPRLNGHAPEEPTPANDEHDGGEDQQTSAQPSPEPSPDAQPDDLIDPRSWTAPAEPRQWIVVSWIPRGVVTALYGDGGMGKSLLAQQLMTSVATGQPWIGQEVLHGRALGIMCEDDEPELHRRQDSINRSMEIEPERLDNLRYSARLGRDNILMAFDGRDVGSITEAFNEIDATCYSFKPDLLVCDTIADFFGGNENNRSQVRQFVQNTFGRLARTHHCAVLVCGHPSVSGIASGAGTGGSTAWSNTVRSRLYLTAQDGDNADPNARILSRKKANYAARDAEVNLVWRAGCLIVPGEDDAASDMPDWQIITEIFKSIDTAWVAKKPWSIVPQSRMQGRYLPTFAKEHFNMGEKKTIKLVQDWLMNGYLAVEIADRKTHNKGLQVIKNLTPYGD